MTSSPEKDRKGAGRSVSYPFIDLEQAVEKLSQLFDSDGTAAIPPAVAIEHWGYSQKSSNGGMTLSALIQYGLLDESGYGPTRKVKIARLALDILHAPEDSTRQQALQTAALNPKLNAEVFEKFPDRPPSDGALKHFLLTEKGFNPSSLPIYAKSFARTMEFAGAYTGHSKTAFSPALRSPELTPPRRDSQSLASPLRNKFVAHRNPISSEDDQDDFGAEPSVATSSLAEKAAVACDRMTLNEGVVSVQWPQVLSKRSYEDFRDWLELLMKRLGRNYEEDR